MNAKDSILVSIFLKICCFGTLHYFVFLCRFYNFKVGFLTKAEALLLPFAWVRISLLSVQEVSE